MAWIKRQLWDVLTWTLFVMLFFGCEKERKTCESCQRAGRATGAEAETEAMPSSSELRAMALDCAAEPGAADCADTLADQIPLADDLGCSAELEDLLSCVEEGNAWEADGTIEWACDPDEIVYRACVGGGDDPVRAGSRPESLPVPKGAMDG